MKKSPTRFLRRVDNKFTSASLYLDFQNMTTMDSRVTFTRASNATYFDGSGILRTAGNNVPRFDVNPTTLAPLGLLIEEQRTNSIRNNTMQGAVAGTPGTLPTGWQVANAVGLTTNVIGFGLVNGISYLDFQVTGTPNSTTYAFSPEANNQIVAASGQSWTSSAYLGIVGGSINNISSIILRARAFNSGGGGTEASAGTDRKGSLTSSLQRFSESLTLSNATTAFINQQLLLNVTAGVAIDITLRIGLPQLEQGAFATSVIPTTTAAATRNADVASMTGTNFSSWYSASEGTLYVDCINTGLLGTSAPRPFSISDGTNNNIIEFFGSTNTSIGFQVISGNSSQANIAQTANASTPNKLSAVYKVNDFAISINGLTATTDTSGTVPTVDIARIGNRQDNIRPWNGTIRKIAYWPVRLENAQLQALTR